MIKHLTADERRKATNRRAMKGVNVGKIRLSANRSGRHIEIQAIDDVAGRTVCAASSKEKAFTGKGWTVEGAAAVGKIFAERFKKLKLTDVYFDRGGYIYHGRIRALADAIREGGIKF